MLLHESNRKKYSEPIGNLKAHYILINRTHLNLGSIHSVQGGLEVVSKNTN